MATRPSGLIDLFPSAQPTGRPPGAPRPLSPQPSDAIMQLAQTAVDDLCVLPHLSTSEHSDESAVNRAVAAFELLVQAPDYTCSGGGGAGACMCLRRIADREGLLRLARLYRACVGLNPKVAQQAATAATAADAAAPHLKAAAGSSNNDGRDVVSGRGNAKKGAAPKTATPAAAATTSIDVSLRNFACEKAARTMRRQKDDGSFEFGECCCWAAVMLITQRSLDFWHKTLRKSGRSRAERLEIAPQTAKQRAILAEDVTGLLHFNCCGDIAGGRGNCCLAGIGAPALRRARADFASAKELQHQSSGGSTLAASKGLGGGVSGGAAIAGASPASAQATRSMRERDVLKPFAWDATRCQPTNLCAKALQKLFGVSVERVGAFRAALVKGDGEAAMHHGLKGGKAWNASSEEYAALVWTWLTFHSRFDPEDGSKMSITDPELKSMALMYEHFVDEMAQQEFASSIAPGAAQSSLEECRERCKSTFSNVVLRKLVDEGMRLYGISFDHNKCGKCKIFEMTALTLTRSMNQIKIDPALSLVDKKLRIDELSACDKRNIFLHREHLLRDSKMRGYRNVLRQQAKHLRRIEAAQVAAKRIPDPATTSYAHCTRNAIKFIHMDDRTSPEVPRVPQEEGAFGLEKWKFSLAGFFDFVSDHMSSLCSSLGDQSKKDSSGVVEEVLLQMIRSINGEKIVAFMVDCGPLNHGSEVGIALAQLLVDLGVCEQCIVLFHEQLHSKDEADRRFGAQTNAEKRALLISQDDSVRSAASIKNAVGVRDDAIIINQSARVEMSAVLTTMYPEWVGKKKNAFKALDFKYRNLHVMCAAKKGSMPMHADLSAAKALLIALIESGADEDVVNSIITNDLRQMRELDGVATPSVADRQRWATMELADRVPRAAWGDWSKLMLRKIALPYVNELERASDGEIGANGEMVLSELPPDIISGKLVKPVVALLFGAKATAIPTPARRVDSGAPALQSVVDKVGFNCYPKRRAMAADLSFSESEYYAPGFEGLGSAKHAYRENWIVRAPRAKGSPAEPPEKALILAKLGLTPSAALPANIVYAERAPTPIPVVSLDASSPHCSAEAALASFGALHTDMTKHVTTFDLFAHVFPAFVQPARVASPRQLARQKARTKEWKSAKNSRPAAVKTAYHLWLASPAWAMRKAELLALPGSVKSKVQSAGWKEMQGHGKEAELIALTQRSLELKVAAATAAADDILKQRSERALGGSPIYEEVWISIGFASLYTPRPWSSFAHWGKRRV